MSELRDHEGYTLVEGLLEDGPSPGKPPEGVGAMDPPPAEGPLGLGSDRDIYNSQLCGPGPN